MRAGGTGMASLKIMKNGLKAFTKMEFYIIAKIWARFSSILNFAQHKNSPLEKNAVI